MQGKSCHESCHGITQRKSSSSNDYVADVVTANKGAKGTILYDIVNIRPTEIQSEQKNESAGYTANTQEGPRSRGSALTNNSVRYSESDVNPDSSATSREITREEAQRAVERVKTRDEKRIAALKESFKKREGKARENKKAQELRSDSCSRTSRRTMTNPIAS